MIKNLSPTKNQDAFRDWFGRSQIVDRSGKPLIVYHGTNKRFDRFKYGELGFHFGNKYQALSMIRAMDKQVLLAVCLKMESPLRLEEDLQNWADYEYVSDYLIEKGVLTEDEVAATPDLQEALMIKGYDGYIYPNGYEGRGYSYAVFSSDQVLLLAEVNGPSVVPVMDEVEP